MTETEGSTGWGWDWLASRQWETVERVLRLDDSNHRVLVEVGGERRWMYLSRLIRDELDALEKKHQAASIDNQILEQWVFPDGRGLL